MNKWLFPLKLNVLGATEDSMSFENIDIENEVEIPVGQHVGAFGVQRKFDVHRGVDLYCPPLDPVFAVEDGIVVDYRDWTGEGAGSPWWEDTEALLIEGESGVIVFGEIVNTVGLKIGDKVSRGDHIGNVVTVLKKDKGRPMTMLHVQMYKNGYTHAGGWKISDPQPGQLVDSTPFLLEAEQH